MLFDSNSNKLFDTVIGEIINLDMINTQSLIDNVEENIKKILWERIEMILLQMKSILLLMKMIVMNFSIYFLKMVP